MSSPLIERQAEKPCGMDGGGKARRRVVSGLIIFILTLSLGKLFLGKKKGGEKVEI